MRDDRGRYVKLKDITENGPAWAKGCPKCKFGIVTAPALTRAADLHLERLVQAIDGDITFCDCTAGQRYRVYLLNRYRILVEEARRLAPHDKRMMAATVRSSHPDIDIARAAILHAVETAPPPTVHVSGEGVRA